MRATRCIGRGKSNKVERVSHRLGALSRRSYAVHFEGRSKDRPNRLARIERRGGILENCLHLPPYAQQFMSGEHPNVATFEQDFT
jgi:hypothetical protein